MHDIIVNLYESVHVRTTSTAAAGVGRQISLPCLGQRCTGTRHSTADQKYPSCFYFLLSVSMVLPKRLSRRGVYAAWQRPSVDHEMSIVNIF